MQSKGFEFSSKPIEIKNEEPVYRRQDACPAANVSLHRHTYPFDEIYG